MSFLNVKSPFDYLKRCEICGKERICKPALVLVNGRQFRAAVCTGCESKYKATNFDPGKS